MGNMSKKDAAELIGRGIEQLDKALELVRRAVAELDDVCTRAESVGVDPKVLLMDTLAEKYNDLLDSAEDTVLSLENIGIYDPTGEDDDDDSDDAEDEELDVDMGAEDDDDDDSDE